MRTIPILIPLVTCTLTACGPGTLTVRSTPEGALITSGNQTIGVSPYTVELSGDASQLPKNPAGCYLAPGFTAKWASGAEANSPAPTPLCNGIGADYTVNIARPVDAPGLQKDLEIANQRASVLAKQQEAQSINNVANAIEMNSMMNQGPFMPYPYW